MGVEDRNAAQSTTTEPGARTCSWFCAQSQVPLPTGFRLITCLPHYPKVLADYPAWSSADPTGPSNGTTSSWFSRRKAPSVILDVFSNGPPATAESGTIMKFSNLKVGTRLALGFALLLATCTIVGFVGWS